MFSLHFQHGVQYGVLARGGGCYIKDEAQNLHHAHTMYLSPNTPSTFHHHIMCYSTANRMSVSTGRDYCTVCFLRVCGPTTMSCFPPAVVMLSGRSMVSCCSVPIFFSSSLYALQAEHTPTQTHAHAKHV